MENNKKPATMCICKSVFKSGENTISRKQFTQTWIDLINKIEKGKGFKIVQK